VVARVLLATRSSGKIRELRALFAANAAAIEVVGLDDAGVGETSEEDALESSETFEENALAKARYFQLRTGLATVADDSGLCVDALGGAPGVHSKRWSGRSDLEGQALDDANNALLLERLSGAATRRARYVCAAAFTDGSRQIVERGESAGVITAAPRGDGGFGYDPYFLSDELGRTFAEVSLEEKATVSHRGRAFRKLVTRLLSGA
jgi:XTP/dITP diphosphohydrolase